MHGAAWISLLRRIPATHHNSLLLMTTTGAEIVLQRIIRLERDFFVALGRMSGSTDQGKVLIIPYHVLTYLAFSKRMTDAEVQDVLGKRDETAPLADSPPEPVEQLPAEEAVEVVEFPPEPPADPGTDTPLPGPEPAAAPGAKGVPKGAPPSKSILLARLRQRLANDIARPPAGA